MKSREVWPFACFIGDGVTVGDKAVKGLWRAGVPSGVPFSTAIGGNGYDGVDTGKARGVGGMGLPRIVDRDSVEAV